MAYVDIAALPVPAVYEELDYETIRAKWLARLTAEVPAWTTANIESDPIVKLIELQAEGELNLRQRVNDATRAVLLASATGTDLDLVAADYGVTRRVLRAADPDADPPVAEVKESDESVRRRCWLSLEKATTAGSRGSYLAHALEAHTEVADAYPASPSPGVVDVIVASTEGDGVPSDAVIAAVLAALGPDDVRPLTDTVRTRKAKASTFALDATLTVRQGPSGEQAAADARAAVLAYIAGDGTRRIGRAIDREKIAAALLAPAGSVSAVITTPAADVAAPLTLTGAGSSAYYDGTLVTCSNVDKILVSDPTDAARAVKILVAP